MLGFVTPPDVSKSFKVPPGHADACIDRPASLSRNLVRGYAPRTWESPWLMLRPLVDSLGQAVSWSGPRMVVRPSGWV